MLRKLTMCLITSATLAIVAVVPPAASAAEYVRQSSTRFTISGSSCTGTTWIGQTASNSIQATVTVSCPATVGNLRGDIYLRRNGNLTPVASKGYANWNIRYASATTSTPGGARGTRWCAHGVGTVNSVAETGGYSFACITI